MTRPNIFKLLRQLSYAKDGQTQKIRDDILTLLQKHPDAAKQTNKYGLTPLHFACWRTAWHNGASLEVVNALLKAWPDAAKEKNEDGHTPLHYSCGGALEVVAALLNVWPDAVKEKDRYGNTILHMACCHGGASLEEVVLLLNTWLSYKENKTNSAMSSLHCSSNWDTSNCTEDVKMLFSHLFSLCSNNTHNHSPKEIMEYFIRIQLWNGTTLVLDRHPTVIKTINIDTKVMADFISMTGRCCNLATMWEVLRNEQDLLEGV